ncbi:MAG TPA: prepilin peptidase [Methylophilaceae bacterium]|jgi:Flp pilus assembly protein protease CpaA
MLATKALVVAWSLTVCLTDLKTKRIPNALTFGAMLFGIGVLLVTGQTALGADWQSALLAAGIGLMLTAPAWFAGWLGGGDVKLLLAIGLLSGWHLTLFSFIVAGLLSGVAVVLSLLLSRYFALAMPQKRWLPFGAALSAGLLLAMGVYE